MYVILDDCAQRFKSVLPDFATEGVSSVTLLSTDFHDWFRSLGSSDIKAIEGFIIGQVVEKKAIAHTIRQHSPAGIFALVQCGSLERRLDLLTSNFDDVFEHAVHVKEILAKSRAILRRVGVSDTQPEYFEEGRLRVYFNGRDIEMGGGAVVLPRRELRVLEYLVANRKRRVTRSQIFSAVYGAYDEETDEKAVETHVSRLRKRLRKDLGYDPIEAKRYLGYQFVGALNHKSEHVA